VVYSLNSFKTAEALLNSLKVQGSAFIEDSKLLFTQDWFREFLKKNGFEVDVTRFQEGRPVANKIKKKFSCNLDLSKFSKRYTELLNENKGIFLKWGFDRLNKASPLDQLYHDFYSLNHYEDLL
jgi:hypothetical protein